jgi:hypothetical protein
MLHLKKKYNKYKMWFNLKVLKKKKLRVYQVIYRVLNENKLKKFLIFLIELEFFLNLYNYLFN